MTDTIKLLETIGKDASLRYAPAETLAQTLADLGANQGLKRAASTGDSSHLSEELGHKVLCNPQTINQYAPQI